MHAFIDGELPVDRVAAVAVALRSDPVLAARVAAFAADKAALAAAYRPVAEQPVPAAWVARIERAAAGPPMRRRMPVAASWVVALAASIALIVGVATLRYPGHLSEDSILAQAEAVRLEQTIALRELTGAALADVPLRDSVLAHAVGFKLSAPDLARLGWTLAEIDTYANAAALRYRSADGVTLTLFIRPSTGTPQFDMLKTGEVRICVWQDEVVGAVMMGNISAGQMMRVAALTYAALKLTSRSRLQRQDIDVIGRTA